MFLFGVLCKFFFAAIQFWVDHISDRFQARQSIFQKTLSGHLTFLRTFSRMFLVFECRHRFFLLDYGKVRTIYPKPTCSNRTKICSNRTFFIFSTCSNRTWAFCKSLIMNKSSWKYGSFPKICKQSVIFPTSVFYLLFSVFIPAVFNAKRLMKLPVKKPTYSVLLRFRSTLLPSLPYVFLKTMFYSYNQIFINDCTSADEHISTRFSSWKTRFLYVSAAPKNLKNDRLSDIFFQKTRKNLSSKRVKSSKNRDFIEDSAI